MQRPQIGFGHQLRHAMLAAGLPILPQLEEDPENTIDALARDERRLDQPQESGILDGAVRTRLLQPLVVAAWRHLERATYR